MLGDCLGGERELEARSCRTLFQVSDAIRDFCERAMEAAQLSECQETKWTNTGTLGIKSLKDLQNKILGDILDIAFSSPNVPGFNGN